jgi:HD-GYP domain-containing protein (c-di-GMP phosphodiesterase class II)
MKSIDNKLDQMNQDNVLIHSLDEKKQKQNGQLISWGMIILCIAVYLGIIYLQGIGIFQATVNGVLAQFLVIISVYLAASRVRTGFLVGLSLNVINLISILLALLINQKAEAITGLVVNIFTIVSISIIGVLTSRNARQYSDVVKQKQEMATLNEEIAASQDELALAYEATIEGWSRAMDLRDKETEGHTQRVTEMTVHLAWAMGMSNEQIVQVRRGALLHDMGKLGVPDSILLKPGKLTDEEMLLMRKHPQYAYDMFSSIEYLRPALDIPHYHHEKWDGTGYPNELEGEQIPLPARIFAVVDVWDALQSDRPYRKGWTQEKVLEHIRAQSGIHFDPKVVELFIKVLSEKKAPKQQAG